MKIILLILLLLSYSCSNIDASGLDDANHPSTLEEYDLSVKLYSQTWKIVLLENNGIDETTFFSSYRFKFNKSTEFSNVNSGTINAISNVNNNGNWSVYKKVVGYYPSEDRVEFGFFVNLNFSSLNEFLKINGEWKFNNETNTKIEFVKIFNNEIISHLTLEKMSI